MNVMNCVILCYILVVFLISARKSARSYRLSPSDFREELELFRGADARFYYFFLNTPKDNAMHNNPN